MSGISYFNVRPYSQLDIPFQCRSLEGEKRGWIDFKSHNFTKGYPSTFVYLTINTTVRPGILGYTLCAYSVDHRQERNLEFSICDIPANGMTYTSLLPIALPKNAILTKVAHFIDQSGQLAFREEETQTSTPPPCSP